MTKAECRQHENGMYLVTVRDELGDYEGGATCGTPAEAKSCARELGADTFDLVRVGDGRWV